MACLDCFPRDDGTADTSSPLSRHPHRTRKGPEPLRRRSRPRSCSVVSRRMNSSSRQFSRIRVLVGSMNVYLIRYMTVNCEFFEIHSRSVPSRADMHPPLSPLTLVTLLSRTSVIANLQEKLSANLTLLGSIADAQWGDARAHGEQ